MNFKLKQINKTLISLFKTHIYALHKQSQNHSKLEQIHKSTNTLKTTLFKTQIIHTHTHTETARTIKQNKRNPRSKLKNVQLRQKIQGLIQT